MHELAIINLLAVAYAAFVCALLCCVVVVVLWLFGDHR